MNKVKTKGSLFDLLPNAKGFVLPSILSPLFMIGEVVLEVLIPTQMAQILNHLQDAQPSVDFVMKGGLIMVIMSFCSLLCGMMSAICASVASVGFGKNIRRSLFYKVQTFSFLNIDKFSTASLVTRCTTDVTNVQNAYMQLIRSLVRSPIMFVMATIYAFRIKGDVAIVFLIAIPVILLVGVITLAKASPRFRAMLKGYDKLNAEVQENLINIRTVKAFVREDHEKKSFNEKTTQLMKLSVSAEKIIVFMMPAMQFIMYGCKLAITGIGGGLVMQGDMEVGDLSAMITYAVQMLNSLLMLTMIAAMYVTSKASIVRICEVLSTQSDMADGSCAEVPKQGSIQFDNVSFSYANDSKKLVLQDINLDVASGETVGIIGGTGEGKSSLVQLIPRLYDVDEGSVRIDGKDVRDYEMKTLRDSVAMVLQRNVLFSGTIEENLKWGNLQATQEEIEDACRKACAHDFITAFPQGYQTVLGQGGVNVSGGQKQRLCIARALLKKPRILILDDSTSAVDTKTDEQIRLAFATSLQETTKIIIAQRIASVINADKIVVLQEGRIADVGTHEQLLKRCSIYQEVFATQFKEVSEGQGGAL